MKLYERVMQKYPTLFSDKDKEEITAMLGDKQDNKYLTAVVMGPYIEGQVEASRLARVNYLVFMDEVEHKDGPFARKVTRTAAGATAIESPYDRLKWFYYGLTKSHPLYELLMNGENGVRERKNLLVVDDRPEGIPTEEYAEHNNGAFDEIKAEKENPMEGWWWIQE